MSLIICPICAGAGTVKTIDRLSDQKAWEILTQAAADHWAVPYEIIGEIREPNLVAARRQIAHLLQAGGWSSAKIGRFLHRDHSTVLYYLRHQTRERSLDIGQTSAYDVMNHEP